MTPQLKLASPVEPRPFCPACAGIGTLEATDMFCGAGGSSLGLEGVKCEACGRPFIQVTQAINHWDLAVEAHNANFPDADHDVHDVHEIPAKRFRRTPIFWASPECVNHTSCKGKRDDSPEAQRSRATFKDIVRFTEHHRYDAVIVENVIEARVWCEHENCACGAEFDAWYRAMTDLGYDGKIVFFNSQFALPTPQSRDRMYVVFWREGLREPALDFTPPSWCGECEEVVHGVQAWKPASKGSSRERIHEYGRYGANYLYRCPNEGCAQPVSPAVVGARSIIDWTYPIERIGDRRFKNGKPRPLSPNTRKRIKVGWENIGRRRPMAVQVGGNLYERNGYARVWSLDWPLKTITQTNELALVTADRDGAAGSSTAEPTPAMTTRSQLGLVVRAGGQSPAPADLDEPMNTITSHDRQIGLVVQNMENNVGRDVDEPVPPVTTGGNHMLVQVNRGPKSKGDTRGGGRSLEEPTRTIAGPRRTTARPLVITEEDIDDCYLRMLQWPELLRAQAMHIHGDGRPYELTASRRNKRGKVVELSNELRTKMIGNAVSSPVATMLGRAVFEVLR